MLPYSRIYITSVTSWYVFVYTLTSMMVVLLCCVLGIYQTSWLATLHRLLALYNYWKNLMIGRFRKMKMQFESASAGEAVRNFNLDQSSDGCGCPHYLRAFHYSHHVLRSFRSAGFSTKMTRIINWRVKKWKLSDAWSVRDNSPFRISLSLAVELWAAAFVINVHYLLVMTLERS